MFFKSLHNILLFLGLSMLCPKLFSQNIKFLPLTKYNATSGIPRLNTRKILKDKFGFMWIATEDGIYRFDGKNSFIYGNGKKERRFNLAGIDFFDMIFDSTKDNIWVVSGFGDLNKINIYDGTVKSSISLSKLAHTDIWSKSMGTVDNNIYVGTSSGMIVKYNPVLNKVTDSVSLAIMYNIQCSVDNILIDKFKNIWFFVSGLGILISDANLHIKQLIASKQLFNDKADVAEFTDCAIYNNSVIISSTVGIKIVNIKNFQVEDEKSVFYDAILPYLQRRIDCISIIGENIVLCGPQILLQIDLRNKKHVEIIFSRDKDDQKWLSYTSSLLCDNKSIWIGSQYGTGCIKDNKTSFTGYFDSMDSSVNRLEMCMTLFHKDNWSEFICTDDGLYKVTLEDGRLQKLLSSSVYAGIALAGNHIMASGGAGTKLVSFDGVKHDLTKEYPELQPIEKLSLVSIEPWIDSLYFLSTFKPQNIYCWNKRLKKISLISSSTMNGVAKGYYVNRLFLDSQKNLWILFSESISIYNPATGQITELGLKISDNNGVSSSYLDITETKDNYWIAAYGAGILKLSKTRKVEKLYGAQNGLNNLGLAKIFPLNDSLIIASSNNGIAILNSRTGKIKNYFEEDGLHGNYFQQFSGDKNGDTVFLGGSKGFTMIDIKKLDFTSTPANLYITSVVTENGKAINDTFNLQLNDYRATSDVIQVTINFTATDYLSSEKDSFVYRVLEISKNWVSTDHRSVKLMGLSPGTYTLQIKNAGIDAASAAPLTLVLTFLPKWYQTIWFDIAIALAVFGILYAFYRYRIGQLKKQQEIRLGIASDLHDDIGSALNTVKVFTHLAKRDVQKDEHLNQIEESVTQATIGLRDMIWILDDTQDTLQEIMERIKKFALPVAGANGIALDCITETAEGENRVNKTKKRNLLLIAKESINNSIKYAQCKNMQVLLQQKKNKITLIIKDDGIGFDAGTVAKGYGLKNIQQRAKQMNCTAEITSASGEGTTIKITSKS